MRIVLCGDLLPTEANDVAFSDGRLEAIFDDTIIKLFRDCDYSICNLEGPLTKNTDAIGKSGPSIKASPSTVNGINELGVTCLCTANNHIFDYGVKGYYETINTIESKGISWVGSGDNIGKIKKSIIFSKNDYSIGIYNVCEVEFNSPSIEEPGCNLFNSQTTLSDIQSLKNEVDYLIVVYHGGIEEFRYPSPLVRERFHNMVDAGADLIASQHSHCVGTFEMYNGATLVYGQGNFQFARTYNDYTATSLLVEIIVDNKTNPIIKYHLLRRDGGKTTYDPNQNLEEFYARARILESSNPLEYEKEYSDFCKERVFSYIDILSGYSFSKRILKRILPKDKYNKYLLNKYNKEVLYSIINSFRDSDHRETVIKGLSDLVLYL